MTRAGTTARLSPVARRVTRRLAAHPRVQVTLAELWAGLQAAAPELLVDAGKRSALAGVLDELVTAGVCGYPKEPRSWDTSGRPRLPRFVRLLRERPSPKTSHLDHPWVPDLARWLPTAKHLTTRQLEDLKRINAWLARGGPAGTVLPLRERSYEVFGDEKRLDGLVRGALFQPGRLTPRLLGAAIVHPPFVVQRIGHAMGMLVLENHTTHASVVAAAREHFAQGADTVFGWIAYGAGRQFEASVPSAAELTPVPDRIAYFGDLDRDGLDMAANAARVATTVGLPPIQPHRGLYRMLFKVGRSQRATASAQPSEAGLHWLGDEFAQLARQLLQAGERHPQEAVTRTMLRASDGWLATPD